MIPLLKVSLECSIWTISYGHMIWAIYVIRAKNDRLVTKERGPQDSNLCGQSPSDFESDSLTTRTEPPWCPPPDRHSFHHPGRPGFLVT